MKLSQIEIDAVAIESGAWRPALGLKGVEFKLRGAGNSDWERLNDQLRRDLPPAAKFAEVLPKADAERITAELLLGACLQDWRGLEQEDGAPIPFDADLARKLLTDAGFRKFRQSVLETAFKLSEETIAERDAAAKN